MAASPPSIYFSTNFPQHRGHTTNYLASHWFAMSGPGKLAPYDRPPLDFRSRRSHSTLVGRARATFIDE
jgi:hypothetical protein